MIEIIKIVVNLFSPIIEILKYVTSALKIVVNLFLPNKHDIGIFNSIYNDLTNHKVKNFYQDDINNFYIKKKVNTSSNFIRKGFMFNEEDFISTQLDTQISILDIKNFIEYFKDKAYIFYNKRYQKKLNVFIAEFEKFYTYLPNENCSSKKDYNIIKKKSEKNFLSYIKCVLNIKSEW